MASLNIEMGAGLYSVTEISHSTVTLSDGIDLAMKVWLPCGKDDVKHFFPYFATEKQSKWTSQLYSGSTPVAIGETFPTIMEYIPYSKDSAMTLERDRNRHTWFCSHGFVVVRVDIRGTGVSGGLYFDEYDEQEFLDCIEVIEWISSRPWSNQNVGMYGKSWGGFNGLQVAYKQPQSLKAVISLYSTDNRFADDMHYEGNAIIGNGLLSWAGTMMVLNGRPPHPKYFDSIETWKNFWINRLKNAGQSFLCTWLHHQHPCDPYWQHGSICQDPLRLKCPVLVIGGHTDAYTNAAFRMAGTLNEQSRAIIGPWSHQWPDVSIPGPNIDYLQVCLKWWSSYLKGDVDLQREVQQWPRLKLFIRDSVKPSEIATSCAGKWVDVPSWNARLLTHFNYSNVSPKDTKAFSRDIFLGSGMKLLLEPSTTESEPVAMKPNAKQGSGSGPWLSVDCGFSKDQSLANENSHCWISDVLEEDIVFAGLSKMFVSVQAKTPGRYCLHVRVCDQFPSGESFLVTRGFKNLSESDGWVSFFPGNTKKVMCVNLKGVGQIIRHGHRILISITPTYFPMVYPAVNCDGLIIYPNESYLHLQTHSVDDEGQVSLEFEEPKPLLKLPVNQISPGSFSITETDDNGKFIQEVHVNSGVKYFPSEGYEHEEKCYERYCTDEVVSYGDISANQSITATFDVQGHGKIKTCVETAQKMTGDKQAFKIEENIKVVIDGEDTFTKSWDNVVPRKYV